MSAVHPQHVSFGRLVRERRRQLGMTQRQLSQAVACAEITLRKIEADQRAASPHLAQLLTDTLWVHTDERERYIRAALVRSRPAGHAKPAPVSNDAVALDSSAEVLFVRYNDALAREAFRRLDQSLDALRAALSERLQRDPAAAQRLSGLLLEYWIKSNQLTEGRSWSETALLHDASQGASRALALLCAGVLASYQGDLVHGLKRLEACDTLLVEMPPVASDAVGAMLHPYALHLLGWTLHQHTGDFRKAAPPLLLAIARYEAIGQRLRAAHVRCDLALCGAYAGQPLDLSENLRHVENSLSVYRAEGNAFGEAFALGIVAECYLAAGDGHSLVQAEAVAWHALESARGGGFDLDVAWALSRLSEIYRLTGRLDEARVYAEQALTHFYKIGDRRAICFRLQGLAQIARACGDTETARKRLAASLEIAHDLHSQPVVMRAFSELIVIALETGRVLDALVFHGALSIRREFLSDVSSRAQLAATDGKIAIACLNLADDVVRQAHARGAAMSLRGLVAFALPG